MLTDILISVAATLLAAWLLLVTALIVGRAKGVPATEGLRVLPDVLRLLRRLAADPALPRPVRARAWIALAWLLTGWQAYAAIRRGEVTAHRRWMIRNFALTYAAVTLRIEMPLLMLAGMNSILALNVVGWTCWIPNLLAVEWWMKRKEGAAVRAAPAF